MTLNTLKYQKRPERVEVVELTKDNVEEVARWCGGTAQSVRNILNHQDCNEGAHVLQIPSLYGGIEAEIGSFVARNHDTGRFSVMTKDHLETEYERYGLRQDGFVNRGFPKLGGNE